MSALSVVLLMKSPQRKLIKWKQKKRKKNAWSWVVSSFATKKNRRKKYPWHETTRFPFVFCENKKCVGGDREFQYPYDGKEIKMIFFYLVVFFFFWCALFCFENLWNKILYELIGKKRGEIIFSLILVVLCVSAPLFSFFCCTNPQKETKTKNGAFATLNLLFPVFCSIK